VVSGSGLVGVRIPLKIKITIFDIKIKQTAGGRWLVKFMGGGNPLAHG